MFLFLNRKGYLLIFYFQHYVLFLLNERPLCSSITILQHRIYLHIHHRGDIEDFRPEIRIFHAFLECV